MLKKLAIGLIAFGLVLLPLKGIASAATIANPIANSSVETGTTLPSNWTSSSWTTGTTNTPTFEYVSGDAHTGSKSLKVTMSNYSTDGDAKWIFDPVALTVGKQYRLSLWYKSNVAPKIVAMYNMSDGTEKYFGMPSPYLSQVSATEWKLFSDTFNVPEGAVSVSTFMFLDKNGWIQTDDYSIDEYTPQGFSQGLVSLTFDDGHEENNTTALPLLEQHGFDTTQCFATDFVEHAENVQTAVNGVLAFQNAGHEICSHTVTHPMLTTLTDAQLQQEVTASRSYLQSITGAPVNNLATPFGDYDERVVEALKAAGYSSHRTVDEGFNSKDNFDPYRIRVQNIFSNTTAAQVRAWAEQAKADKTWLVLVYHRIANADKATCSVEPTATPTGNCPATYDSFVSDFAAQLNEIAASGIAVKTWQAAITDVKAQMGIVTPPVIKPGDVNGDSVVDALDLSTVLSNWNRIGAIRAQGDINGDGTVDALDLSSILANWSR